VPSPLTAYSTASVLHTRLRRSVASSFAVGFALRTDRSRDRDPKRDARVFRPCSRCTEPSCDMILPGQGQRSRTPCAHRLGEQTKTQYNGRVLSSRDLARQSPNCRAFAMKPGLRNPAIVFKVRRLWAPHAFHEFD